MPSAMPGNTMPASRLHRLRPRQRGRVTQIRSEHQDQRRNDAESQKCVQRWQDGAQVAPGTARQVPHYGRGSKAA
jgi:hypothetical protein